MSTIVPINGREIVDYIFENSEKLPNDFYVGIMDLMKEYHHSGSNVKQIFIFLDSHEVDSEIIKKIKDLLILPKRELSCKYVASFVTSCVVLLIVAFVVGGFGWICVSKGL